MAKLPTKNGMQENFPEIELYMWSLNQEYPDGLGMKKPLKLKVEAFTNDQGQITEYRKILTAEDGGTPDGGTPWSGKVSWAIKFDDSPKNRADPVESFPLLEVLIREEDFGALIFDPRRDRVFRTNRAGLEFLNSVISEYKKSKSLSRFEFSIGTDDKSHSFLSFLKGAGLWLK